MPRFKIPNMACGGCAKGVTATLREVDPNAMVQVSLEQREVIVDSKAVDADTLERALRNAGWKSERLVA
ncbi:heavy-metal-associated domain-containing protein [Roseomonas sp. E05]|uniref:heavy-metal-associated domain-containing protein n=1 Tax=Roseomonas sp. E05 TaxID=3046310 RepID=UPI0024BB9A0B|nr:heavy-metal-associated domain-containing protein [Roseomonas sp. E05]MDJ0390311.1 heavy-metal-associated domain-containing protein [Roseomonas sp. E05]